MSDKAKQKRDGRIRRHARVRRQVQGTATRPRLAVYRSNRHVVAQVIDDVAGTTLAAASTLEPDLRDGSGTAAAATKVGERVAARAKDAGVSSVVFDRGGNVYHGRVAAVAEAARAAGLEF
jgi:large subunit ribosomal protein L18